MLRQPKRFSSARGVSLNERTNRLLVGSTLNSDPPEHDATRAITSEPLLPGALEAIAPRIRRAADALVADLAARGVAARAIGDSTAIAAVIGDEAAPGDVVVLMSNGAFGGLRTRLAAAIGAAR